jgi:hypothetical protein
MAGATKLKVREICQFIIAQDEIQDNAQSVLQCSVCGEDGVTV